jgi:membrane protease YdiL (CAAX protease family)
MNEDDFSDATGGLDINAEELQAGVDAASSHQNEVLDSTELLDTLDIEPVKQQAFGRSSILWMTFVVEGSLAAIAIGLAFWLGIPLWETFRWNPRELGLGVAAAIPMIGVLFVAARSQLAPFVRIRELLDEGLLPRLKPCTLVDLMFLAIMAGVCEELLFRTVVQQYFENLTEPIWGLLLASVVFGFLHCVSWMYALLTFVAGVYLGLVWWAIEKNSLPVMVTHAVYDWVAFVYLIKRRDEFPVHSAKQ